MRTRAMSPSNRRTHTDRRKLQAVIAWIVCAAALALPMRAAADTQDVSLSGVWIGRITQGAQGMSAGQRAP